MSISPGGNTEYLGCSLYAYEVVRPLIALCLFARLRRCAARQRVRQEGLKHMTSDVTHESTLPPGIVTSTGESGTRCSQT